MSTNTPFIHKYFQMVVTRPWTVIALSALVLFASVAFLPSMVMDTRSDAFIDEDEPALVYREKVEELFGLADPIVIAVVNDSSTGIYNAESLLLVQWLTEQVQQLSNVDPERVVSLATEANIVGTDEGMEIEDFFEVSPSSPARVLWIKQAVENFPLYQGNLVARDHSATLIVAELLDEFEADETYAEILAIANSAPVGANDQVHVAGEGAIAGYLSAYIDADAQKLNPLAAVVITIVLFIAFVTIRGAVIPNIVVLGTVGATFGLMAAFGVPFYVITNGLTVSLIAMAVADSIHIFSQYYIEHRREPGASQQTLVARAMLAMWQPITLTTITTAAGFLTLFPTSSMPPIQYFGLFGGLGVTLAWFFSVTFLPAALSLLKPKASRTFAETPASMDWASTLMTRIGHVVLGHPRSVLAVGVVVVAVAVIGAAKVTVEEVRIANFQKNEAIYLADTAINASMDGVYHLDVLVETEEYEGLHQSEHLQRIDRLQRFLETQPGVGGTTSVVDYIKQMHRAVNENRADAYSIPDDAFLISQLFLLYSASADPTDFEEEVDGEYRQALVRAQIDNGSYLNNKPVVEATRAYLRDEFNAPGITGTLTGRVNVDHYWIEEIGSNHAKSVGFAFLVVALVVIVLFRSVVAGIITTLPVAMAILLIYAWMGFSNVWLGVGTTMFASIAIGLCVDFTIHTVDRLRDLLRDRTDDVKTAMLELYPSTGRALFFNLVAIAFGFGVLITSDVPPLTNFGTLVALAVLVAFVASVTLLPALIYLMRPAFIFAPAHARFHPGLATVSVIAIGIVSLFVYTDSFAGAPQIDTLNGEQVMQAVNARDEGERVSRDLRIELTDRRGKIRVQETRGFRRYFGEEKRTVIFYRAPSNIRDTAFLTYDYPDAEVDDDQWLYLPALRKVRRISASDRGDYFLGTDFTYEEIKKENKIEISDYHLTRIGSETVNGFECIVVEGEPRTQKIAKELGYSKVVWRVDPVIWMSRSSDYWDVNGNHLKTIDTPVIEQIDGIWTALEINVVNHKTNHRSAFTFSNVDYSADVPEKLFGQRSLTRDCEMNRWKLSLVAMAVLVIASRASAAALEVGFQAEISIASAVERGGDVQKSELSFEPRMDVWFDDNVRLTGIGLVRADFADELEPGRSSNDARSSVTGRATYGDHVEFELRELFVDFEIGEMQARIGKQQVVWGQADGLRILDVINPLSYREFILADFEDRRIPLWMVNAEVPVGAATLQVLWIPDQTYDEFPETNGSFAFTSPKFRPVLRVDEIVRVDHVRKPNSVVEDSDFGLRLSTFVGGWDLTANYLYHYQDQPAFVVDRSEAVTRLTPTYERTHLIGGSASKAFGDYVFRSELGYSTDRYFSSRSITGVEKSHELSGVVGLDYSGLSDTLISGQFFMSAIDQGTGIVRDAREENLSLLIHRNFFNDTLTLEMLAIHNLDDSDGVVQLDVSYQLTSNTTLSAGADVFYGTADGLFGQFDERDRLNLRLLVSL